MTEENKELLIKDLCARLPYKVIVEIISYGQEDLRPWFGELSCEDLECFMLDVAYKSMKPYLRPMSSMTKEEKSDLGWIVHDETDGYCTNDKPYYTGDKIVYLDNIPDYIDFIHEHHLDYRGLIEKGLALEAPANMYNIKS